MMYGFGIYVCVLEGPFERPIYLELEIHMEGYGVSQALAVFSLVFAGRVLFSPS
jgi:hypothetical protein